MAAIDFPNSPTIDQIFTVGDRSWKYTGQVWQTITTGSGPQGDRGGLRYQFSESIIVSNPGVGQIAFDSATVASVTNIAISSYTLENTVVGGYIDQQITSTSLPKSYLIVQGNVNGNSVNTIFAINSIVNNNTWKALSVSFVSGTLPTSAQDLVISFSKTGDRGNFDVSETTPTNPKPGQAWFNSNNGRTYFYYDGYWVENSSSLSGPKGEGFDGITSSTSTSIPTAVGEKTFTFNKIGALALGQRITIANTASPLNWMQGIITEIDSGTRAVKVYIDSWSGSASVSTWTVSVSGVQGPSSIISVAAPIVNSGTSVSASLSLNSSVPIYNSGNLTISGTPTANTDATNISYVNTYVTTAINAATANWQTKSSAYTLVVNDRIFANTTNGGFNLTLPASPTSGSTVTIHDVAGRWGANPVTVLRNSTLIMGLAEDLILNIKNATVTLVYSGATFGWRVV